MSSTEKSKWVDQFNEFIKQHPEGITAIAVKTQEGDVFTYGQNLPEAVPNKPEEIKSPDPELLTTAQTAKAFGISKRQFYRNLKRLLQAGLERVTALGKRSIKYRKSSVLHLLRVIDKQKADSKKTEQFKKELCKILY